MERKVSGNNLLKAATMNSHHQYPFLQDAQKKIGLIERENKALSARLADIYRGAGMVDCWNEYQQKRWVHGSQCSQTTGGWKCGGDGGVQLPGSPFCTG